MNPIERNQRSSIRTGMITALLVMTPHVLAGPSFDSGSDGSDGALDLTGEAGEFIFDPAMFKPPLDQDRDNVYHFTSVIIPAGVTVMLRASELQFSPVVWLASRDVDVQGTIDLSGENGHDDTPGARRPSLPGPGGFHGGVGRSADSGAQAGMGPGGGGVNNGGGHATGSFFGCGGPLGTTYGNTFLVPLTGGSGGGGNNNASFGGGAGGGAVLIASSTSIRVDGALRATGGNGLSGCAGGGAGGGIRLVAPVISGSGEINANRGFSASFSDAGLGRVRLEASQHEFTGTVIGVARRAVLSPNAIIASPAIARARVVSVAGIPVPADAQGEFTPPDVMINSPDPVELVVELRNVPLTAEVQLRMFADGAPDQVISASFLSGDQALSTWSGFATFPLGFSRVICRAQWVP